MRLDLVSGKLETKSTWTGRPFSLNIDSSSIPDSVLVLEMSNLIRRVLLDFALYDNYRLSLLTCQYYNDT